MDAGFKSSIPAVDTDSEQIRILVCHSCKSIEELPDWQGRPEDDVLLNISVERHQKPEPHLGALMRFPLKYWVVPKVQEAIIAQIRENGASGLDVYGTKFYETKSQFGEDAMTCWGLHNRTHDCGDYKSDRKILKPGTEGERKSLGLTASKAPTIYLCDFCPVKSIVQKKAFKAKGLYN